MDIGFVDHYDSFSFNVIDWLRSSGPGVVVHYASCDDAQALKALQKARIPLVISPGPKRPEDAPLSLDLLHASLGKVPLLGICLGHQMLAYVSGAKIINALAPFHGSQELIHVTGPQSLLLADLEPSFRAAVYHSLCVDEQTLTAPWRVTAYSYPGQTGSHLDSQGTAEGPMPREVQAIERLAPGEAPAFGLQFHPESFLSEKAAALAAAWYRLIAKPLI